MADFILNATSFIVTAVIVFLIVRKNHRQDPQRRKSPLRYFTMQSNILCAFSALLMCAFPRNDTVWYLKYIGTAAVTITVLTVFLFLAPSSGKGGLIQLLKGWDLYLHLLNPLIALISFCVFEKRGMSFGCALLGMIPVALYGSWYLYKIRFAAEEKRWDDFYGFNKGGKWPVYLSGMMIGTFLMCMALMGLQNM